LVYFFNILYFKRNNFIEYKPKAFMWELVKMWERIGLILILNIY
jgi:hypothetical protein